MARHARHCHAGLMFAAVPFLVAVSATPATAAPYPPPDQPTTSTSASEVAAGDPVTVCPEHYGSDVQVRLTDDGKKVTPLQTDSSGRGCVTVVWKSPNATAKPIHDSAAGPGIGTAQLSGRLGPVQTIAYRAPSGPVCHTLTNTGPDASGSSASTEAQVCVEPANDTTGSSSGGGHVSSGAGRTNEHGQLPFTGAEIAGMVIAALAAIGVGTAAVVAARRRR